MSYEIRKVESHKRPQQTLHTGNTPAGTDYNDIHDSYLTGHSMMDGVTDSSGGQRRFHDRVKVTSCGRKSVIKREDDSAPSPSRNRVKKTNASTPTPSRKRASSPAPSQSSQKKPRGGKAAKKEPQDSPVDMSSSGNPLTPNSVSQYDPFALPNPFQSSFAQTRPEIVNPSHPYMAAHQSQAYPGGFPPSSNLDKGAFGFPIGHQMERLHSPQADSDFPRNAVIKKENPKRGTPKQALEDDSGSEYDEDYVGDDDDGDEYIEHETPKPKAKAKSGSINKSGTPRKPREPRPKLQKWESDDWKMVLLHVVAACGQAGIQIPFEAAARGFHPECSASALQQALLKLRTKLKNNNKKVPVLKMSWSKDKSKADLVNSPGDPPTVITKTETIKVEVPIKTKGPDASTQTHLVLNVTATLGNLARIRAQRGEEDEEDESEAPDTAEDDHRLQQVLQPFPEETAGSNFPMAMPTTRYSHGLMLQPRQIPAAAHNTSYHASTPIFAQANGVRGVSRQYFNNMDYQEYSYNGVANDRGMRNGPRANNPIDMDVGLHANTGIAVNTSGINGDDLDFLEERKFSAEVINGGMASSVGPTMRTGTHGRSLESQNFNFDGLTTPFAGFNGSNVLVNYDQNGSSGFPENSSFLHGTPHHSYGVSSNLPDVYIHSDQNDDHVAQAPAAQQDVDPAEYNEPENAAPAFSDMPTGFDHGLQNIEPNDNFLCQFLDEEIEEGHTYI